MKGVISVKVVICAGPPTSGKTTVLRQSIKRLQGKNYALAYLKVDVQYAEEDEVIRNEFGILTKKVYSADLCPDHCTVLILGDAIKWAEDNGADILIVETAGLCLRCSPYIVGSLGIVVLEATSGVNLARKIGPILSQADIAVVSKIDLISQAEREVFRAKILEAVKINIIETDALHGINIDNLVRKIEQADDVKEPYMLKGNPPLGTCTICVGKKEIGWKEHYGVVRSLDSETFYRGE